MADEARWRELQKALTAFADRLAALEANASSASSSKSLADFFAGGHQMETLYNLAARVVFNGKMWRALNDTRGERPGNGSSWVIEDWEAADWHAETFYARGALAERGDALWLALADSRGITPGSSPAWRLVRKAPRRTP